MMPATTSAPATIIQVGSGRSGRCGGTGAADDSPAGRDRRHSTPPTASPVTPTTASSSTSQWPTTSRPSVDHARPGSSSTAAASRAAAPAAAGVAAFQCLITRVSRRPPKAILGAPQ
ncbi:hypothetical protein ACN27J_04605 [Solwaraspora sp. WMMB762]|uniref:hypothetical protein n=1 Tax=Solwaraspora sp. WMMB762 TaxID=3404120 RepID=UPI003B92F397